MNRILILLTSILLSCTPNAQEETSEQSDWLMKKTWKVPSWVKVHEGKTKNGNPKYWIKSRGHTIHIHPNNYEKYKNGEYDLHIIKWQHVVKDVTIYRTTTKPKAEKD